MGKALALLALTLLRSRVRGHCPSGRVALAAGPAQLDPLNARPQRPHVHAQHCIVRLQRFGCLQVSYCLLGRSWWAGAERSRGGREYLVVGAGVSAMRKGGECRRVRECSEQRGVAYGCAPALADAAGAGRARAAVKSPGPSSAALQLQPFHQAGQTSSAHP